MKSVSNLQLTKTSERRLENPHGNSIQMKILDDKLARYRNAIHGSLPGSEESKLCTDKNGKHCDRS